VVPGNSLIERAAQHTNQVVGLVSFFEGDKDIAVGTTDNAVVLYAVLIPLSRQAEIIYDAVEMLSGNLIAGWPDRSRRRAAPFPRFAFPCGRGK